MAKLNEQQMDQSMIGANESEQRKYVQLQIIDQQLGLIQQQLGQLDQQIAEITVIFDHLDEMKLAKEGDELLVPLVNGVFLKCRLADEKSMLVNVGGGALVPKTNSQLKELLEKQRSQLANYRENMLAALQNLYNDADRVERSIKRT